MWKICVLFLLWTVQNGGYPQQTYYNQPHQQGYPGAQPNYPIGQPGVQPGQPVINNYYQGQPGGGSSGGGFAQTALAVGAGALGGYALSSALNPSKSETVIIHENASPNPATNGGTPAVPITPPAGKWTCDEQTTNAIVNELTFSSKQLFFFVK